jgi:hypothetical protein
MRIPTSFHMPSFLAELFRWKSAAHWFLTQYSIAEFNKDLDALVASDISNYKIYITNFKALSPVEQQNQLKDLYLRNEVKYTQTLLTNPAEFAIFFASNPKKLTAARQENIKTIRSNLPLFTAWGKRMAVVVT